MADTMILAGPDDCGYYHDDEAVSAWGFGRLAIIDLTLPDANR
jgi:asparagine synthetase B (glutamine-hydrolysing)